MEFTLPTIISHMGLLMAADYAHDAVLEVTKTFLTKEGKPINHDLQRATREAFLAAQQIIARECHEELIAESPVLTYLPPHREEIEWLDVKVKEMAKQLGQLRRDKTVADEFVNRDDLNLLCGPDGQLAEEKMTALRQKLVEESLKDCISPCYRHKVETELFQQVSDRFMAIIRENPKVSRVFEARWLAQISMIGQEVKQKVERLEEQMSQLFSIVLKLDGSVENMNNVVLAKILKELQQLTKDSSMTINRMREGSIVLVLQGSCEGVERLKAANLKEKEIAGFRVEDVLDVSSEWEDRPERYDPMKTVTKLAAWFQKNFSSTDWLLPGDLALAQARTSSEKTERGIQLNLREDANQAVILIVTVQPSQAEKIEITLWFYPIKGAKYLPSGLQIMVLDEQSVPVEQLNLMVGEGQYAANLGFKDKPGERFAVKLALGEKSVVKEFEI